MKRLLLAATALALTFSAPAAKTKVLFSFDTEDYTNDRANDAIRDIANLLASEGVKGNFNIVGYLATRLVELNRTDVIDALKKHVIGSQTLYHSVHPDVAEQGDAPDYTTAYRQTALAEARCVGMLDAAFGEGRCVFWCPPGNSISAVAFDVYADMGVPFTAGCGFDAPAGLVNNVYSLMLARPGREKLGLWYFNMYHLPYSLRFHLESMLPRPNAKCPDYAKVLDELAQSDVAMLYMHPHMAVKTRHWDFNYKCGNLTAWRQWKVAPDRDPAETAIYYERFKAFIRAVKADARFEITDLEALRTTIKPRVTITTEQIPAIRTALAKEFSAIHEPASWCVADVFQAAVKMLGGKKYHQPGKVYGFLARPQGVTEATEVSAEELRAAAAGIDLTTFLPTAIRVGGKTIGPADFLFAALEVLETGAARVTVTPREQLGSFTHLPGIEKMNIAHKWVHTPEFEDAYLSERLRLQLWTYRIE